MAIIDLPKGSGKRLKVREKSVKSQGILKWILSGNPGNMEVIFLWFVSITLSFFFGGIVRYGEKPVIFRRIKIESNFTPKRK